MKTYKIAVAGLIHEAITFMPGLTTMDDFLNGWSYFGEDVITKLIGTNTCISGFQDFFKDKKVELIPFFWCTTDPFKIVAEEAYDFYAGKLKESLEEIKGDLDGVLLDLHGAMVTENRQDPETDLVSLTREIVGNHIPVMVTLDMHANQDQCLTDLATGVFGYQSSPHIDVAETGVRAATALWRTLQKEIKPVMAIKRPGVVVPAILSATDDYPAKVIIDRLHHWMAQPSVIDVTALFGFAWADVSTIGMSMIAITDNDKELAEKIADDLCQLAIDLKDDLSGKNIKSIYSVEEGVQKAMANSKDNVKPVLLVDQADRSGDTTFLLHELIKQNVQKVAVPSFFDPISAQKGIAAGVGNTVALEIGGQTGWRDGGQCKVTGKILWCGIGKITGTGPMSKNKKINLGPTAIVEVGGVWIQLVSKFRYLLDDDSIVQFGWKVNDFDIIVTKSKTHYRAGLGPIVSETIIIDAPGQCPVSLDVFEYTNLP